MVQYGCVEHKRGYDFTRGEEEKGVYEKIKILYYQLLALELIFF